MLAYAITRVSEFRLEGGSKRTGDGFLKRFLGRGKLTLARGLCVIEFVCCCGVGEVLVGV